MSAKIHISDELKADIPAGKWGKILAATPIVMTVIATLLAGLSSGEMTRAQYDRALAAQQQSKAGDQWNYFQAKRLRAALQRNQPGAARGGLQHNVPGARHRGGARGPKHLRNAILVKGEAELGAGALYARGAGG